MRGEQNSLLIDWIEAEEKAWPMHPWRGGFCAGGKPARTRQDMQTLWLILLKALGRKMRRGGASKGGCFCGILHRTKRGGLSRIIMAETCKHGGRRFLRDLQPVSETRTHRQRKQKNAYTNTWLGFPCVFSCVSHCPALPRQKMPLSRIIYSWIHSKRNNPEMRLKV